jgi:phosphatidylserine/phosphatidylglycerophosphate/cardiolipin synthase-like enzyme
MTKKRRSSKKRSSRKKTQSKSSSRSLLLIVLVIGALFVADRVGLITIDWQAIQEGRWQEALDAAADNLTAQIPGGEESGGSQPVAVEPVSGEWYQLYFTSPQYPDDPATRVNTTAQGLVQVINSAQRSLDIAIYELDLEEVGDAILAAKDRGVQVRLVTDSDEIDELETLIRLKDQGIPIVPDERSAIMHNKFVVVDGQAVWTGSYNFTPNGTYRNNNNAIYIQSPQLAQNYTPEFEEMFTDFAFGPTSPANTAYPQLQIGDSLIETCFSPEDNCMELIIANIKEVQQSIRFMAFSFTHDELGQAVRAKAQAGVTVQGIFETRGSETEFSEFGSMKQAGLDVWQDGNPYTLHHKVFILDDKTVVTGSLNFSENAANSNDENVLIIHNADIAKQYVAEFERVYQQAQNPPGE